MTFKLDADALNRAIAHHIEKEVNAAIEAAAERAAEEASAAVRERLGQIVIGLLQEYDVRIAQDRLVITVRYKHD